VLEEVYVFHVVFQYRLYVTTPLVNWRNWLTGKLAEKNNLKLICGCSQLQKLYAPNYLVADKGLLEPPKPAIVLLYPVFVSLNRLTWALGGNRQFQVIWVHKRTWVITFLLPNKPRQINPPLEGKTYLQVGFTNIEHNQNWLYLVDFTNLISQRYFFTQTKFFNLLMEMTGSCQN
jgi:hypothetical protein